MPKFIDENGGDTGVRLRKRHQKELGKESAGIEFIGENGRGPGCGHQKKS